MSRILFACVALTLAACADPKDLNGDGIVDATESGRSPDTVSLIAPSTPIGTVSGVVVDSLQAPIPGVNVTLVIGEGTDASNTRKLSTSADGAYLFKDLPAGGTAQLIFSKTGYSNARISVGIPGSSGNFPINNGNGNGGVLTLTQTAATVKLHVFTAQGKPAKGAKAYLDVATTAFVSETGTFGTPAGNFTGTGDIDENGVLTFLNAPDPAELARVRNTNFVITIGAFDEDGDLRIDALGSVTSYSAQELFIQPDRTILLPDARVSGPLAIIATNLDSFLSTTPTQPYRNAVKASDPITIVFNQPITQTDTTRTVKVVLEDCATNFNVAVTQRAPNVLSIAPLTPWTMGSRYNIVVRATGLGSGTTVDFIGYFFVIDPTLPRPLGTTAPFQVRKAVNMAAVPNTLQPGDTLHVLFDTPIAYQAGGLIARALVDADLNNDGSVGGAMGPNEFGGPAGSGFQLEPAEQTVATDSTAGTFTCKVSGYSSRWQIRVTSYPMGGTISTGTRMKVVFPKDQTSSDSYQTAWGSPVVADVGGTISIAP